MKEVDAICFHTCLHLLQEQPIGIRETVTLQTITAATLSIEYVEAELLLIYQTLSTRPLSLCNSSGGPPMKTSIYHR